MSCQTNEESVMMPLKLKHKKHSRRLSKEIEKNFVCPYKNCQKSYGGDMSLNLHIKIKHNGGNKTDRERLAGKIITAYNEGKLCQVMD